MRISQTSIALIAIIVIGAINAPSLFASLVEEREQQISLGLEAASTFGDAN